MDILSICKKWNYEEDQAANESNSLFEALLLEDQENSADIVTQN